MRQVEGRLAQARVFDEMLGADGAPRALYERIARWLEQAPPALLESRRQQAELMFRRIGITFAVYGDQEATERLIPFDIVPRVIGRREWNKLEAGLIQRVKALNAFLADIYGKGEILRAGIVPSDIVFRNAAFRPEMAGRPVPHDIYIHIAGIDVVRVDAEDFYVLEDNARTPSGVSYMLENREVMMRLAPDLFASHRVAPVENYPENLHACLRSVAPLAASGDPTVVLLTPGQFNSAYYEHSFLADKLGVELVEGRDLFVRDDCVYMRTTQGLKRVDVIYRRLDDDFLDPLAFRADSALGVPGLMSAYQAGNVTLANAVGTGVADDKAIYTYMPEIIPVLPRPGAVAEERADVALPRARGAVLCPRPSPRACRQGSERLGRLRDAGRPAREQGGDRAVRQKARRRPRQLHRAADARALHLPRLVRRRRVGAARRSQAVRAFGRRRPCASCPAA